MSFVQKVCRAAVAAAALIMNTAPALAECADGWRCLLQNEVTEFKQSTVNNALHRAQSLNNGSFSDRSADFVRQQKDFAREQATNRMISGLFSAVAQNGKQLFGENFRLVSDLSYKPGKGITGNWDAVVPLGFAAAPAGGTGAFFLQSGATHYWQDGIRRSDKRYGGVWRFAVSDEPQADIFGAWAFMQRSAEYGHERLHFGGDYAAGQAQLSLDYFLPLTGWRGARFGYEERALEIGTAAVRFALTRGLALGGGIARRQDAGGSSDFSTSGLFGLAWHPPRRRFSLKSAVNGIGGSSGLALDFTFTMPLGGPRRDSAPQNNAAAFADLYRPVAAGKIEVAERKVARPPAAVIGGAQVRFLQSSASTGSEIQLQAALPAPASRDTQILVKLAPGNGANPAVPGVDYKDAPIELLIRAGEATATVTVALLHNPGMTAERALNVVAYSSGGNSQ